MAGQVSEIAGGATQAGPSEGDHDVDLPLAAGTVIDGRYRLLAEIGAGGMGRVYEAEHMFIRRRMALKLLRRGLATAPEAAARLVQEATLAGQVRHPTIVQVFDCAVLGDGQVYLAMELLRGESLEMALRRPGVAVDLMPRLVEVARGLAAVHRVGVVHRDIKPANIFLARSEHGVHAKLLDFGVAKLLPGAAEAGDAVQTQAGAVLGTPYYLAPEQARGGALDGRADLYSVGVILYELLTGSLPFLGASFMEILAQHVKALPLDPRQAAPGRGIPDGLARLTMRLLAKDPAGRVADGEALAEALEGLMRTEGEALARLEIGTWGEAAGRSGAEAGTIQVAQAGTMRMSGEAGEAALLGMSGEAGDAVLSGMSEGAGAAVLSSMSEDAGAAALSGMSEGAGADALSGRSGGAGVAGTTGRLGLGIAGAVVAGIVIAWGVVRWGREGAAVVERPVGAAAVVDPGRPVGAVTVQAAPAAVQAVPEAGTGSTGVASVGPPPEPVREPGKVGKKRPREGGTKRGPTPPRPGEDPRKNPSDPQLKPDVYDE